VTPTEIHRVEATWNRVPSLTSIRSRPNRWFQWATWNQTWPENQHSCMNMHDPHELSGIPPGQQPHIVQEDEQMRTSYKKFR